ncbi:hypothetical protein CEE45_05160 [Candidatus Heimdallarchaeota archaeon B3_Heim]|nr:MAG: hypothetical protein CEE45_05160 [Candidatus Heimdallarchaeota archaeon B3_Heim]
MSRVICPNCSNHIPANRYCIFCGETIEGINTCTNCGNLYSNQLSECPICSASINAEARIPTIKTTPWYITRLLPFDSSLLIIFILSSYFIFQLIVGTVVIIFLPFNVFDDAVIMEFLNLFITIISNLVFILVLIKYVPFTVIKIDPVKRKKQTVLLLVIVFLVSVTLLEMSITLIDNILDYFAVPPSHSSPYDVYFANPLVTILFSLLVIIIGPLFEEIIFRQHVISFLEGRISSKVSVILLSSAIFSLNHLPADLQNGSFRFTIEHLFVVFFLGVVLGLIFYRYGLLYAVFFHSFWNSFSLLAQLETSASEITVFLDFLLLIAFILTIILSIFVLVKFKYAFFKFLTKVRNIKIFTKENALLLTNSVIIITFELLNAYLLNLNQDIAGIGIGVLLGLHAIGIVIGFLIFEYKSKTPSANQY